MRIRNKVALAGASRSWSRRRARYEGLAFNADRIGQMVRTILVVGWSVVASLPGTK